MAEMEKQEFKFPDEADQEIEIKNEPDNAVQSKSSDFEIEIEDDTPAEDRNRTPADPEKVKALEVEVDDLDKYSKDAKDKLIRMKRIWNDERRRADEAERERQAAIDAAQRLMDENKKVKALLSSGEKEYVEAITETNKLRLNAAKKAYQRAYEEGDAEKMAEAQEDITKVTMALERAKQFKLPPLQEQEPVVQPQQQYQPAPRPDEKVMAWQAQNSWFGQDEEMTAAALGLHEKLKRQGVQIGSDEYYAAIDKTMRKRFPENFDDLETEEVEVKPATQKEDAPKAKPATVVAPATRTTGPKKVKLKTSQMSMIKKLGITPEQYVREVLKLEV